MLKFQFTRIYIFILMLILHGSPSWQLSLKEGQNAHLTFPYPCDSTEVTLRHGYKVPFYRLTSPQDQGQRLRVHVVMHNGNCYLDLMISGVMRSDVGTYISSVYKDGEIQIDETHRIWLGVDYPPGQATCIEVEGGGRGGDWVKLECTADVGSLSGKIECYQSDEMMPSLTNPVETYTTLTQVILARTTQPVFCCSCTLNEKKGRCGCNDTALYLPDDTIKDPCPTASPITTALFYNVTENTQTEHFSTMTSTTATKMKECKSKSVIALYILVPMEIMLLFVILFLLYKLKIKTQTNRNCKTPCKCKILFSNTCQFSPIQTNGSTGNGKNGICHFPTL